MSSPCTTASPAGSSLVPEKRTTIVLILGAAAVGLLLYGIWQALPVTDYIRSAVAWIDASGPISILVFYCLYVVCALVGIPRTLFNVSAGFMFSFPVAIGAVLVAAATAHALSFFIARNVARDWVERRLARLPNVECLLHMVKEESFKVVFLIRLNPFIPGIIGGYGFGTTGLPFRTYIVPSILGFIPVGLAQVYLGWVGGKAMLNEDGGPTELQQWLLYGGVVVSIVLVAIMLFYGKRALNSRMGASK